MQRFLSGLKAPPANGRRFRPRCESLEARDVPATLVGLTTSGSLVEFDSSTPGTLLGSPVSVTGLIAGDSLVGIAYDSTTGNYLAVGSGSHVYTIDPTSGVATPVSTTAFTPALSGTAFGVTVDPVTDLIRVISNGGQSLRISPTAGTATADPTTFYDTSNSANTDFFTSSPYPAPVLAGAAVSDDTNQSTNAPSTALYAIDTSLDTLVEIGTAGDDSSQNTSSAIVVGQLRDAGFNLVPFNGQPGLAIQAQTDQAFASDGATVYGINLTSAQVTSLGSVGGGYSLSSIAFAPTAAGAGTLALGATSYEFAASRAPVVVTVNRTGGATGAVSVNYATSDGSGVAGTDYYPASGTLSFADGQTTQTIVLNLPAAVPPSSSSGDKTFTLTLSSPAGGAALGAAQTATVTIPEVTTVPSQFYAVGSSSGAQVSVFNAVGGQLLFTFNAFEGNFGGEAHVAVADINGDGYDDIIVGAGPGGGPRVVVYDGKTLSASNQTEIASFNAFAPGFQGGISVAAGDVNGDGFSDIVVGAGPGAGPNVVVFDGSTVTSGTPVELASFYAFDPGFVGGVTVAAGNVNGDSNDDVIVGAGPGGGSHVSVFDGKSLVAGTATTLASFFAFDSGFQGGVSVGAGDINGDGRDDVLVGAGVGGSGHVEAFSGIDLATNVQTPLASFLSEGAGFAGGVTVTARDLDQTGSADLIVGTGTGGNSTVLTFDGPNFFGQPADSSSTYAFAHPFSGGVFVG